MIAKIRKKIKRQRINIFFSVFFGILLFAAISFLIVSNWRIHQKKAELYSTIETLKQEIQNLEKEKQGLEVGVELTSNNEAMERKLREQGYKKPGEEVVVVKKEKEEQASNEEEQSFFEKILEKFKRD